MFFFFFLNLPKRQKGVCGMTIDSGGTPQTHEVLICFPSGPFSRRCAMPVPCGLFLAWPCIDAARTDFLGAPERQVAPRWPRALEGPMSGTSISPHSQATIQLAVGLAMVGKISTRSHTYCGSTYYYSVLGPHLGPSSMGGKEAKMRTFKPRDGHVTPQSAQSE